MTTRCATIVETDHWELEVSRLPCPRLVKSVRDRAMLANLIYSLRRVQ
jgi:hypothetical protein